MFASHLFLSPPSPDYMHSFLLKANSPSLKTHKVYIRTVGGVAVTFNIGLLVRRDWFMSI